MRIPKAITNLTESFERLPGIGPKSASRLTYYLLHVPQTEIDKLTASLAALHSQTVECSTCHNISETDPCDICVESGRDENLVCVVAQPLDVLAIERGGYKGKYHVLHGVLDPLKNIGPDEIRFGSLIKKIKSNKVSEIILALNLNMEGEATCLYINRQINTLKSHDQSINIKVTRIAHGLPMGSDIEYADDQTLSHALSGRREY